MLEMLPWFGMPWFVAIAVYVLWYAIGCVMVGVFSGLLNARNMRIVGLAYTWPVTLPVAIAVFAGIWMLQHLASWGASVGFKARRVIV